MSKYICTITPNPALDLGGFVDDLKPNEKAYVQDETRFPGGNAINVARILTRLKVPNIATGFLGGSTGEEIKNLLKQEKVKCQFVPIKGNTRISVTVSNNADHQQTRLSFPGPQIGKQEKQSLFELIQKKAGTKLLVVGGSLPSGFSTNDVVRIIKMGKERKIPTIVDCPGKYMKNIIPAGPLLIKPNLEEFQELTQTKVERIEQVQAEAKKLLKYVPLVCVSSVEKGTLLVTEHWTYFGRIVEVPIKSTVGAGDSMVGAMAGQIFNGNESAEDLLKWGLAAAAATLSHTGTAMGAANEIMRLYRQTKGDKV